MPETYSVFAKFRHRRLTLMRRIPKLGAAIEFAERIRALRFHDPDTVFIVADRTGEIVEEQRSTPRAEEPATVSAPRPETYVHQTRNLTMAEEALHRGVAWARQVQDALPALGLAEAIGRIELAVEEVARARAVLESAAQEKPRAG